MTVLVVNAGSSSLKYQLLDPHAETVLAAGLIERIGEGLGSSRHTVAGQRFDTEEVVADHSAAFEVLRRAFATHGPDLNRSGLVAIGHRVVHGGADFSAPTLVTDEVLATIRALVPLAPLHNPANLTGIEAAIAAFPGVPQVAVFDTAFHASIPPAASTYAIPEPWRSDYRVRRYGFHGTSHAYVSRRAAALLGRDYDQVATIVLHLGNGASACAVDGGRSVDTSMGLSPLGGLVMGTRSGDVDPAIHGHLQRMAGMTLDQVDAGLNRASGLLGLSGSSDFRELMARRERGDVAAQLAFDVVTHRLVHYVGAYAAELGRLDAIVFTAGVGENTPALRAAVLRRLGILGVEVDEAANAAAVGEALITRESSRVAAYVIPTNEEGEIASQAASVVAG